VDMKLEVVVEGAWPGSVVLLEFARMADAQRWHHSPEYQKIVHLRTSNAISALVFVEGIAPDFSPAELARQIRAARKRQPSEVDWRISR
jgi:hypothetical protein